jgi:hypothetical protein
VEPVRASFPEEDGLQKNVLVRSMTYQSDAFARELGINRLPCLVFFDDPRTNCPAGILPLAKPDRDAVDEIRELLSAFATDPDHSAFFSNLRDWHAARDRLDEIVENGIGKIACGRSQETCAAIGTALLVAEKGLRLGSPKIFRRAIRSIEDRLPLGLNMMSVDAAIKDLRRIQLRRGTTQAAGGGVPSDATPVGSDQPEASGRGERAHLIPRQKELVAAAPGLDDPEAMGIRRVLSLAFEAMGQNRKDELGRLLSRMNSIAERLSVMQRPDFSPHFASFCRRKRLHEVIGYTRSTANRLASSADSILAVVNRIFSMVTPH